MSLFREAIDLGYKKLIYPKITAGSEDDREKAHDKGIEMLQILERDGLIKGDLTRAVTSWLFSYSDKRLETESFGVRFPNPIGVAAGLDKNGRIFRALGALGFGHIDIGSATLVPFRGNPRPRIFYHKDEQSLTNRMGFPGEGLDRIIQRLNDNLLFRENRSYVVSLNIGASKPSFEIGKAMDHYVEAFDEAQKTRADYITVNLSSPNTEGVRQLQDPVVADELLDRFKGKKPYLIKLGPDLALLQYQHLIEVARRRNAQGIVLTNTSTDPEIKKGLTSAHKDEVGGTSGLALRNKARNVRREVSSIIDFNKLALISAGGLLGPFDDWEAISYEGAIGTARLTSLVHENSSSPNFAYGACKTLINWMDLAQIKDLNELRGSGEPIPSSKR